MIAILIGELRTLIKIGNPDALDLVGYAHQAVFTINNLRVEPDSVPMGGELIFSFSVELSSEVPQALMIDYVVHFQRCQWPINAQSIQTGKKDTRAGRNVDHPQNTPSGRSPRAPITPVIMRLRSNINGVRSGGVPICHHRVIRRNRLFNTILSVH